MPFQRGEYISIALTQGIARLDGEAKNSSMKLGTGTVAEKRIFSKKDRVRMDVLMV